MIPIPVFAAVAAKSMWAWAVPFVGPLLARAWPYLGWVPGVATIKRGLRVALYVAALGGGVWIGVTALRWWQGDVISQAAADKAGRAQCEAVMAAANIEARTAALDQRERALDERASVIETDAAAMDRFEQELEAERANTLGDDAGVVGADDGWLRGWQRRK